jgi:hypothetical protein
VKLYRPRRYEETFYVYTRGGIMRKLITIIIAAALLAVPAQASGASPVLMPNCSNTSYGGKVKPRTWDGGCTGSIDIRNARWSEWGREARARGRSSWGARARLRATRIRWCDTGERYRRFYTRIQLWWSDGHKQTYRAVCG